MGLEGIYSAWVMYMWSFAVSPSIFVVRKSAAGHSSSLISYFIRPRRGEKGCYELYCCPTGEHFCDFNRIYTIHMNNIFWFKTANLAANLQVSFYVSQMKRKQYGVKITWWWIAFFILHIKEQRMNLAKWYSSNYI